MIRFGTLSGLLLIFLCLVSKQNMARTNAGPADTSRIAWYVGRAEAASHDSSVHYYLEAIRIAEKYLSSNGGKAGKTVVKIKLVKTRLALGLVYYNNLEYQKAMACCRLALKEAEETRDVALLSECFFNIAEIHLEQRQFNSALENYRLSLSGYERINDHSSQFWCYTGMGIVQKQSGNYRNAVEFYNQALQKARQAGLKYEEATCYNNLGNVYRKTGDFARAMEGYQKAIEVFRALKEETAISDCLNNIGNLFSDHGDPFRALDYYRQSFEIASRLKDEYRLIIRNKNMAGAYLDLKDYDNAALFLDNAMKLAEKSGDKSFLASCNMLFGKLHANRNDYIIASAFYRKSAILYAEAGAKAEQGEAQIELARLSLLQSQVREATGYAHEALLIAEATGSMKAKLDAVLCLSSCYEQAGDIDKAYENLKHSVALKDSIYTTEKYRTIEEIEAGFQQNELKKKNEALRQLSHLQKQAIRTRNIILLLLTVCLLLGAALIWLIYKRKNEAKREAGAIIEQSKAEIGQLSEDLIAKERELTSKTIFINQKNQLLEKLIGELEELKKTEGSAQSIQHLQLQLKQELAPNAWKEFEIQFNEVHPGFQSRLLSNFPDLTLAERRLCSFIRLDMNTREVSSLTGQSIKSIEVARTRIRKKLGVPHEQNLTNFIALI